MLEIAIQVNILGKLLGRPNLQTNGAVLWFMREGRAINQFPIREIQSFFETESSILGSRLRFRYEDAVIKTGFLQSNDISQFSGYLNEAIATNLNTYLSKIFNEFSRLVVISYPRDSESVHIKSLIGELHHRYQSQPFLWEKYLTVPHMQKVKEILAFYPFNLEIIRKFHEHLQLKTRSSFYDNVESNPLTEEQRLGVIRSNDLNMVLAAAGTGKTSVMVAKALDLIERQLAEPSEILILAYNKAAAEELKERLVNIALKRKLALVSEPHISTFHSLGRHLLREASIPTEISVFAEDTVRLTQWVTHWIYEYISEDPSRVFDLIELTTPPVDAFSFKSKAEYESYIRDNEFRTLNNELVRGYQELQIANFLFINQINYEYEARYVTKRRIEVGFDYKPDFHIADTDIYIEHFGVDRQGNTRPDIDAARYRQEMQDKRNLHLECETLLIESYHYEWKENILLQNLKSKLQSAGVIFKPMHPSAIFEKLKNQEQLSSWSALMRKALQSIRTERLDQLGIKSRLTAAEIYNPDKYSELLDQLHIGYVDELQKQNSIDFDDMIIRAIQVVQNGLYIPQWKYILVDEFQDISAARMEFIQSLLSKGPKPSLTVVGDDWQSVVVN
jgi:DNA helicase-4